MHPANSYIRTANPSLSAVFLCGLLVLAPTVTSAALYKGVDEQGNPVFSDVPPTPDAKPLDLPPVNSMPAPARPEPPPARSRPATSGAAATGYARVEIKSPVADSVIRDNAGRVTVQVALEPALAARDRLRVRLDGKSVADGRSTSITLDTVDRGTHELSVEVIDAAGNVKSRAKPVTFHLLRFSVLHNR